MTDTREYELNIANREANQIHDAEAYFKARPDALNTEVQRRMFDAGYERGWQACEAHYKDRIAELEAGFSPSLTVAMQTIKKQNERIAELEKDAERLDFLERETKGLNGDFNSFRESIDQAIAESKE